MAGLNWLLPFNEFPANQPGAFREQRFTRLRKLWPLALTPGRHYPDRGGKTFTHSSSKQASGPELRRLHPVWTLPPHEAASHFSLSGSGNTVRVRSSAGSPAIAG